MCVYVYKNNIWTEKTIYLETYNTNLKIEGMNMRESKQCTCEMLEVVKERRK